MSYWTAEQKQHIRELTISGEYCTLDPCEVHDFYKSQLKRDVPHIIDGYCTRRSCIEHKGR